MAKGIELFPLIKMMFTDKRGYQKVRTIDKAKNLFMINRRFAINFPIVAQNFNHIKAPAASVVDCWQRVGNKYGKVPGWMYIKTKKKKSEKKKKKSKKKGFDYKTYEPNEEVLKLFLEKRELSMRQYQMGLEINEEKTKRLIWDFETRLKVV